MGKKYCQSVKRVLSKDAPIQDFTDIRIADIILPIKAENNNQSDIFKYN